MCNNIDQLKSDAAHIRTLIEELAQKTPVESETAKFQLVKELALITHIAKGEQRKLR